MSLQVQSNLIDSISSCHCGSDVEKEKKNHRQHRVRIAGLNPNTETNKQQVSSQETVVVFMASVFFFVGKKKKLTFLRLDILKFSDLFFLILRSSGDTLQEWLKKKTPEGSAISPLFAASC